MREMEMCWAISETSQWKGAPVLISDIATKEQIWAHVDAQASAVAASRITAGFFLWVTKPGTSRESNIVGNELEDSHANFLEDLSERKRKN